ncbi:MAG: hypothetical protein FJ292_08560 [Planctomycetes bacterium]|nr:hypothetical protein [Planctomycetota bacterium]
MAKRFDRRTVSLAVNLLVATVCMSLVAERDAEGCVRMQVVFRSREPAAMTVVPNASPEGASVVLRAANLDGIEVDTINGSITSGAFAGQAKVGTSNGSVEAGIPSAKVVSASRGEATVTIGDGTKAKATIDTSNGRVTIHSVNK